MYKNQIEELIDKKLAEAKLEVAEKRLHYFIWLAGAALAIFGVVFPLWQSNRSADKVDSALLQMRQENAKTSEGIRADSRASAESLERTIPAIRADLRAEMDAQSRRLDLSANKVDNSIQDMHKQFKELAGTQLRKPSLECLTGGSSLEGKILKISPAHENIVINVKNSGDAPAKSIRIRLYTNLISESRYLGGDSTQWSVLPSSDDPSYKYAFETQVSSIDPKDLLTVDFILILSEYPNMKTGNYPALVKLFYEQPEPRKYSFTINISGI